MEVRRPRIDLFPTLSEFIAEMRQHNELVWDSYLLKAGEAPAEFVERLLRREV